MNFPDYYVPVYKSELIEWLCIWWPSDRESFKLKKMNQLLAIYHTKMQKLIKEGM